MSAPDPRVTAVRSLLAETAEAPSMTGDLAAVLTRYRHAVRDLLDLADEQGRRRPARGQPGVAQPSSGWISGPMT